jgi:hypothetical protein
VRDVLLRGVDEHDGQVLAPQRRDLVGARRKRDHEQAVDPRAARELAERVDALGRRLDVVENEVVAARAHPLDDPAQPLDHRRRGEERRHHPDRLRRAERQASRRRARAIAELADRGAHALAHLRAHHGDVVEHPRDRRHAHARVACDIPDRGRVMAGRGRLVHGGGA